MLGPYRALWRIPGVPRLLVAGLVARIPFGMVALGIILLVEHETGSYAEAGLVDASYGLAAGVASPIAGRLVDRLGHPRVLIPCAVANAVLLAALVALAAAGAPLVALAACGAAAGVSFPPLSASIRALLPAIAGDRAPAAYALEAIMIDVFFIVGPPVAAVLSAAVSPGAAVLTGAALSLTGCLAYATAPAVRRASRSTPQEVQFATFGALGTPAVRVLVVGSLPFGATFGFVEIALPAFADARGAAENAGLLIGLLAAGSVAGGLAYGARRHRRDTVDRGILLGYGFAAGLALLTLPGSLGALAAVCLVAGLALAPLTSVTYELLNRVAGEDARAEANAWLISTNVMGFSLGAALGGALVEGPGTRASFAAAAGAAALAATWWLLRRGTLRAGSLPAHG